MLLVSIIVFLSLISAHSFDISALLRGFTISLYRVVVAYLISLFLSLVLGFLAESSTWLENALLPILDVAQSFPSFALLPILVYAFGKSSWSVIIILVIEMIWPILFNVIGGLKEERRDQAEAAKIFGAVGWRNFFYYRWPMLRPSILTGSIVSWGEAWDTIVGAEIIAGVFGAGSYLGRLSQGGQTSLLLLGIAIYLLLIFALNQLIWLPLLHNYTKYQAES